MPKKQRTETTGIQISLGRRDVIQITGALLAGITTSGIAAAASHNRFIVDTTGKRIDALEQAGLEIIHDLSQVNLATVEGSSKQVKKVTRNFARDVQFSATPLVQNSLAEDATDEQYYFLQWDKQTQRIPDAHEITRGEGSRIAVLDTGVDPTHPDLENVVNTSLSRNFASDGTGPGAFHDIGLHGTWVSGIAAADDRNDVGLVGTAPGTDLVGLRVFKYVDVDGDGTAELRAFTSDEIAALLYAADNDCDVANMSLGSLTRMREARGFLAETYNRTHTYVNRKGMLVVAAAGNDGLNLDRTGDLRHTPSGTAKVMSVSATGPHGFRMPPEGYEEPPWTPAFYTNYGMRGVDIGAPGGNLDLEAVKNDVFGWWFDMVYGPLPLYTGFSYGPGYGTSAAAPQVTGAAALLASLDEGLRSSQANRIANVLERTASVPESYAKEYYGSGFIDPFAAVMDVG